MTHETWVEGTPDQPNGCTHTAHCTCHWTRPVPHWEDPTFVADRHAEQMNLHEQGRL